MPGVVGDVPRWAKHVDELRNSYAHRRAGFIKKESINEYLGVVLSLRWVLTGILLLQTGVAPEVLANRFMQDAGYVTCLRQIERYLPDVYGDG